MAELLKGLSEFFGAEEYKNMLNVVDNIGRIQDGIVDINKGFGESRQRVIEFNTVLVDSAGEIKRLGGNVSDVANTVVSIAEGARRNVVATTDTITELYAASQLIGRSVTDIVNNFAVVGVEMSDIGEQITESFEFIQGIGLNAGKIMGTVVDQTELLNRFNFEGGVQGFTRMAAQASMVRLDMSKTAAFADKVMNPQGALETAQAFQRLGVAAGTLIDPFALMDASINDPAGLQDSLIEMTKQFTQFNEETGRFEINPGGVRLMYELAEAAGMNYKEFSQLALSAADVDRRLSQINFGIDAKEEDKLLMANLAKMGEGGRYYVEIEDVGKVDLADITQEQMSALRKQYEEGPKTTEELLRSQQDIFAVMSQDLKALPYQLGYAIAGQTGIARAFEFMSQAEKKGFEAFYGALGPGEDVRKEIEGMGDEFASAIGALVTDNNETNRRALSDLLISNANQIKEGTLNTALQTIQNFKQMENTQDNPYLQIAQKLANRVDTSKYETPKTTTQTDTTQTTNVNIDGSVDFNINVPQGVDTKQLTSIINSPEFAERLYEIFVSQSEKAPKPLPRK
jgi:hypothetical protein